MKEIVIQKALEKYATGGVYLKLNYILDTLGVDEKHKKIIKTKLMRRRNGS